MGGRNCGQNISAHLIIIIIYNYYFSCTFTQMKVPSFSKMNFIVIREWENRVFSQTGEGGKIHQWSLKSHTAVNLFLRGYFTTSFF